MLTSSFFALAAHFSEWDAYEMPTNLVPGFRAQPHGYHSNPYKQYEKHGYRAQRTVTWDDQVIPTVANAMLRQRYAAAMLEG